jgi:hypothetical protein
MSLIGDVDHRRASRPTGALGPRSLPARRFGAVAAMLGRDLEAVRARSTGFAATSGAAAA